MQSQNKSAKIIASTLVILAVAALALAASVIAKGDQDDTVQAPSSSQVATTADSQTNNNTSSGSSTNTSTAGGSGGTSASSSSYKNGTYTTSETYPSPGGMEGIDVSLTVNNGVVTAVSIDQQTSDHESAAYQDAFANSYKSKVVGKALSSLSLNRVSGASLTTDGFNNALDQIRSQAQA